MDATESPDVTSSQRPSRTPHARPGVANGGGRWSRPDLKILWDARHDDPAVPYRQIGEQVGKSDLACRLQFFKLKRRMKDGKWSPEKLNNATKPEKAARSSRNPPIAPRRGESSVNTFRDMDGNRSAFVTPPDTRSASRGSSNTISSAQVSGAKHRNATIRSAPELMNLSQTQSQPQTVQQSLPLPQYQAHQQISSHQQYQSAASSHISPQHSSSQQQDQPTSYRRGRQAPWWPLPAAYTPGYYASYGLSFYVKDDEETEEEQEE